MSIYHLPLLVASVFATYKLQITELHLAICGLRGEPDCLQILQEQSFSRFEINSEKDRVYATSILMWTSCAVRPLSTEGLRHALAVETMDAADLFDVTNEMEVLTEAEIIVYCCGRIQADAKHHVRFIHYSAREYFKITQN